LVIAAPCHPGQVPTSPATDEPARQISCRSGDATTQRRLEPPNTARFAPHPALGARGSAEAATRGVSMSWGIAFRLRLGVERPGRRLRPSGRRLLARVAIARWTLALNVAAGLAGTLLLLGQMTLLAKVIADAAQGRLRQVPAALGVTLAVIIMARAGLAYVVEVSGRRTATKVMSALRAELVGGRLSSGAGALEGTDSAARGWRPAPSEVSTASRPTSPSTSRRWSWRSRSPWRSCSGPPSST